MFRVTRRVAAALLLGLIVSFVSAQTAPDIARGTTGEEVMRLYGWPRGKSTTEGREIWAYDNFDVAFQNDRVVTVSPRRLSKPEQLRPWRPPSVPDRTPMQRRPLPVQPPIPTQRVMPVQSQLAEYSPPTAQVRLPPDETGVQQPDTWMWARALAPIAVVLCLAGIGAIVIAERRRLAREIEERIGAGAPEPSSPPKTWQESVAEQLKHASKAASAVPEPAAVPSELSIELLNRLEWKRLELLVALYFKATGVRAECTRIGADGGVDVYLYRNGEGKPYSYVQCKAWEQDVGVKLIRELFGVMAAEKIRKGVFVTTGRYSDDALAFAAANGIVAIDGNGLIQRVNRLGRDALRKLLSEVTQGDYTTPTCPNCDIKLVFRDGKNPFWGCRNYPRCHYKLYPRKSQRL